MNETNSLTSNLEYLKLQYILTCHQSLAQKAALESWDYTHYLEELIQAQAQQKRKHSIDRRIALARFPLIKTLSDYDLSWPKKINRNQVQQLHRLDFINEKSNVLLLGTVGVGKTHLAISLGVKACQNGYRAKQPE